MATKASGAERDRGRWSTFVQWMEVERRFPVARGYALIAIAVEFLVKNGAPYGRAVERVDLLLRCARRWDIWNVPRFLAIELGIDQPRERLSKNEALRRCGRD